MQLNNFIINDSNKEYTINELLDQMVLMLSQDIECEKAFKGGYMLNQLLDNSRMTHDVDFSICNLEDFKEIEGVLNNIGKLFVEGGYIDRYEIKNQMKSRHTGGMDMYDKNNVKILGVDIGFHDLSYGVCNYDIKISSVTGFEIERMLADKFVAILSSKRNRRAKDLYDFFIITNAYDCNCQKLAEYIERRGNAEWDNIPFEDTALKMYKTSWEKVKLINYRTGNALNKPSFEVVIKRFNDIALPLKERVCFDYWDHKKGELIYYGAEIQNKSR